MKNKFLEILVKIICIILIVLTAWYCVLMTAEDDEYKGRWAAEEISRMRAERELVHEQEIDVNEVE